uniref:Phospholysine phosphohistidine inorganic pyrophosphate phosphatase n=2 Tax=Ornithodoros turicata TaxID=34597 RepID=A0A2R5LD44_9ACAR
MSWLRKPIKGVLMDITGVLYESGQKKPIQGSVEAVKMLRDAKIPFRFVTNETTRAELELLELLHRLGFEIAENEILSCVPAALRLIEEMEYRPYLLVHPNILPEFENCNTTKPNCVVLGDAGENFSYENLNSAFEVLVDNPDAVLITLGKGKYYREQGELVLDVGAYAAALEYACDRRAIVIGKPGEKFFKMAVNDLKLRTEEVVMIGDDVVCDVGGAMSAGIRGVLVKTGKFRPGDDGRTDVRPDGVVANLLEAVQRIVAQRPQSPPGAVL